MCEPYRVRSALNGVLSRHFCAGVTQRGETRVVSGIHGLDESREPCPGSSDSYFENCDYFARRSWANRPMSIRDGSNSRNRSRVWVSPE